MGGYSGSTTAPTTLFVMIGASRMAVTAAQHRLIERTIREGGAIHVKGAEVRTARALGSFGELRDDGAFSRDGRGNPDGERWTFALKVGVHMAPANGGA